MIIFISDLHLMDNTVGVHQMPASAVEGVFTDLQWHADNAYASDVHVVFLGDIFDMIVTTAWPEDRGPWTIDDEHPDTRDAERVLEGVMENNKDLLTALASCKPLPECRRVEPSIKRRVTRHYIPGNHDRLCNLPALRRMVRERLGIDGGEAPFQNAYRNLAHRVFARHGHEWDEYNFESKRAFLPADDDCALRSDYLKAPVGDVLTVRVAARLALEVGEELKNVKTAVNKEKLIARLNEVFDVRPKAAMIPWLSYEVRGYDDGARDAVDRALQRIACELADMPFVKDWLRKHDSILNPIDKASLLHRLIEVCSGTKMSDLRHWIGGVERLASLFPGDNCASKALADFRKLDATYREDPRFLYVVYGHTHNARQRAVQVTEDGLERVYLNTGTWRPMQEQTVAKDGFIWWHSLTYTIIYGPGEEPFEKEGRPAFEVWTGSLKDGSSDRARAVRARGYL